METKKSDNQGSCAWCNEIFTGGWFENHLGKCKTPEAAAYRKEIEAGRVVHPAQERKGR